MRVVRDIPRSRDGVGSSVPGTGRWMSEPGERLAERVEAQRAEAESVPVEGLEIEAGALALSRLVPRLEPDPLAHLVGRGLPGPPEVTLPLEAQHLFVHPAVRAQELPAQLRRPAFAGVEAERVVPGDLQLQVHADVDDDAGGPQRLAVQHAEALARIPQVAEIVHQAFGVQRPPFAVTGAPAEQSLPAIEHVRAQLRLGDLQMMAGYPLVVDSGDLLPGGELGLAFGHRPPHPARAGEVLVRPGVVDGTVAGRRDAALDAPHQFGDVEVGAVKFLDGAVGE